MLRKVSAIMKTFLEFCSPVLHPLLPPTNVSIFFNFKTSSKLSNPGLLNDRFLMLPLSCGTLNYSRFSMPFPSSAASHKCLCAPLLSLQSWILEHSNPQILHFDTPLSISNFIAAPSAATNFFRLWLL